MRAYLNDSGSTPFAKDSLNISKIGRASFLLNFLYKSTLRPPGPGVRPAVKSSIASVISSSVMSRDILSLQR